MTSAEELGASIDREVVRVNAEKASNVTQPVATEIPFTIFINDIETATFQCTPSDLKELAVGFLFTSGLLKSVSDINSCIIDKTRWSVHLQSSRAPDTAVINRRLFTSGCGKGVMFADINELSNRTPLDSSITISRKQINKISAWLQNESSPLSRATGCLHTAALSHEGNIPDIFVDDIGRHNAVDKTIGMCLLCNRKLSEMILITSGRVSSEILHKARKCNIVIIIARGAPTHQTIIHAENMNICVIGFARGHGFTVYSHGERITDLYDSLPKGTAE